MKEEIKEKLRSLLTGDKITDESKVTYLLVECRKLFEHDKALRTTLPTLVFYCNWALHIQLSHSGAQAFLARVNPVLTMHGASDQVQHDALHDLFTLETFRSELRRLLQSFGADLSLCDDPPKWMRFIMLYSHVVENSELTMVRSPTTGVAQALAVRKVTVRPISFADLADGSSRVYPMIWNIEYEDGHRGQLDLSHLGLLGATLTLFDPKGEREGVAVYEEAPET